MSDTKTIMFYDGGCSLCRHEVNHYQGLDTAGRIEWTDITKDRTLLQAFGVTHESAMRRLHVLSRDGRLLSGAYAFAVIWSELPYYRGLAELLRISGTLSLLDKAYDMFARWRFRRRCVSGECAASSQTNSH
jgi:predicted DCC family thiol-disulfide oxidoreductase YuxK